VFAMLVMSKLLGQVEPEQDQIPAQHVAAIGAAIAFYRNSRLKQGRTKQ
jgi:hypothetical protein